MLLVVGLGNPGTEYEGTRHNVGFSVADAIAEHVGVRFKRGLGEYVVAISKENKRELLLVKPTTYMNRSGIAVRTVMRQFDLDISQIVIVVDDFHLPLGSIRLREKGAAGGHNGLTSIIECLESNEFKRIRCGIASSSLPQEKEYITKFVLGRFRKSEESEVQQMIERARDAAIMAATDGFHKAMNVFNTKV
ncbi:MAG: aminoacyl-tRNA hydrolase [Bacteroidetes bacterium]|nr:MAG: aminoacyl-tRNA hydrolase [Bacteroidota bacterium]